MIGVSLVERVILSSYRCRRRRRRCHYHHHHHHHHHHLFAMSKYIQDIYSSERLARRPQETTGLEWLSATKVNYFHVLSNVLLLLDSCSCARRTSCTRWPCCGLGGQKFIFCGQLRQANLCVQTEWKLPFITYHQRPCQPQGYCC